MGGIEGSCQTDRSEMGIMGQPEGLQQVQQCSRLICGGGDHANSQPCLQTANYVLRRIAKVLIFVWVCACACTLGP